VREGGAFEVLDGRAASAENSEDEELLTRLWQRGLEAVEWIVRGWTDSDR
jgi:hypothetical protein